MSLDSILAGYLWNGVENLRHPSWSRVVFVIVFLVLGTTTLPIALPASTKMILTPFQPCTAYEPSRLSGYLFMSMWLPRKMFSKFICWLNFKCVCQKGHKIYLVCDSVGVVLESTAEQLSLIIFRQWVNSRGFMSGLCMLPGIIPLLDNIRNDRWKPACVFTLWMVSVTAVMELHKLW